MRKWTSSICVALALGLLGPFYPLAREADLTFVRIDAKDLHFDLFADPDHFLRVFDLVVR